MGYRKRSSEPTKPLPPLDGAALDRLALAYVARYATTRKKLSDYLRRKLAERGGEEDLHARIGPIVQRMQELGYINDAAFARIKADGLARRGYGPGRVRTAFGQNGIAADDAAEALEDAESMAFDTALAFARERRFGPFSEQAPDPARQRKELAAMCRAGHSFSLAIQILRLDGDFIQD
jgi:regulatory protein